MMPSDRATRLSAILRANRVVPVLTIERVADAVPLARALIAGGIRALEITLRTPAALDAARAIKAEVPQALIGLGTVLTPRDLETRSSPRRRFCRFARPDPGTAHGRIDFARAAAPGNWISVRVDGSPRPWLRCREAVSRGAHWRHRPAQSLGGAFSQRAVLPDGWDF